MQVFIRTSLPVVVVSLPLTGEWTGVVVAVIGFSDAGTGEDRRGEGVRTVHGRYIGDKRRGKGVRGGLEELDKSTTVEEDEQRTRRGQEEDGKRTRRGRDMLTTSR